MKNVIVKTCYASILFFMIMWGVSYLCPMAYSHREYPLWLDKINLIESEKVVYRNVLIGDSRLVAAANPKLLGDNYYNFSLGGGTPVEGYYTLKKLIEKGKTPDTLVLSYSSYHLEESDTFWERTVKFGYLNDQELNEVIECVSEKRACFWGEQDYSSGDEIWYKTEAQLKSLRFPWYLRREFASSAFSRGISNYNELSEIRASRGQAFFGKQESCSDYSFEVGRGEFKANVVIQLYLEKMLELAEKNATKVFFVSTPVNESTYKNMHSKYAASYLKFVAMLRKNHPEVRYSASVWHYLPDDCFGDASHVNEKGREKFSKNLKSFLKL